MGTGTTTGIKMFAMTNCITINSDASFHPERKIGAYAFTIRYLSERIAVSGLFDKDRKPQSPHEAELMSIINALALLSRISIKAKLVVVNTDCMAAIHAITAQKKSTDLNTIARMFLHKIEDEIGATVEFRHVKAHTLHGDKRSQANEWCDGEAKRLMRAEAFRQRNLSRGK